MEFITWTSDIAFFKLYYYHYTVGKVQNMKWMSVVIGFITLFTLSVLAHAKTDSLFNVTLNVNTLSVKPTINHNYTQAGIKIANLGGQIVSGCIPNANGYCIFSASPQNSAQIILKNIQSPMDIILCLNGISQLSCEKYQFTNSTQFSPVLSGVRITIDGVTAANAGIKITSSGNSISNGCTLTTNGYCIFSVSENSPANIYLDNLQTNMNIELCLNGDVPSGCQPFVLNNPITLYTGTKYGNVLYSTNGGTTSWTQVMQPGGNLPFGLFLLPVSSVYNLYLGGQNGSLEVSTDGGNSWANAGAQPDGSAVISVYAVSPTELYVGTNSGNVAYTLNSGESWTITSPPDSSNPVIGIGYDSTGGYIYAATYNGLFTCLKSTCTSWTQIPISSGSDTGSGIQSLFFINATNYYVGVQFPHTVLYQNYEGTWTAPSHGVDGSPTALFVIPNNPISDSYVYVGTQNEHFYWSTLNLPSPTGSWSGFIEPGVVDSVAGNNSTIYLGMSNGLILQSPNDITNWQITAPTFTPLSVLPGGNLNYGFTIGPSGNWYVGGTNGAVIVSGNQGLTWTANSSIPSQGSSVNQVVEANGYVYATGQNFGLCSTPLPLQDNSNWSCNTNGVVSTQALFVAGTTPYVSVGNALYILSAGSLVQQGNIIGSASIIWSLYIDAQGVIYAGTDQGIYQSFDNGATWSGTPQPPTTTPSLAVYSLYVNNGSIYAGASDNNLYVSSDGGNTWVATSNQPDGSSVLSLAITTSSN